MLLTAGSWNSVGVPMVHGRIYAGAAAANGVIYIAGGQTDVPSPADTSIERIVQ